MNGTKITITKRDQNYSSNGLKGLFSSIRHSLRMKQNEFDEFEFNEELSKLNRITIGDNTFQLNEYDVDKLLSEIESYYLEEIGNTENNSQNEKDRNYLRQLRKKLNDFSKEVDNEQIEKYVKSAMENQIEFNEPEYRTLLSRNKIKRINQKVDLLERYLVLSEKLKDTKVKNHTNRCKEVILVIPSTNKIPNTDDYGDFIRNTLIDFYKENFPDFEIKLAVSHLDETTPHAHLFLDLKNKNTDKYDFNKKELEFIKEYSLKNPEIKNMPRLEDYEMEGRSKIRQDYLYKKEFQTWKASAIQTAFYEHFNAKSRNLELGLFAKKNEPSKERDKRNKLIEEEAKKPKSERKYNYYTKKIEDMEKSINDLKSENTSVLKENKQLKADKNKLNDQLAKLQNTFDNGKNAVKEKNKSIAEKDNIILIKEKNIEQKSNLIKSLDNEITIKQKSIKSIDDKLKENKEIFNNEVDRVCDILEENQDDFIIRIDKKLGGLENIYKKFTLEISEIKKSFQETMTEFVGVMSNMKKLTLEFSTIKNNDKRNGLLDGFKSLIHWSLNDDKKSINDFYKKSMIQFEEYNTGTLLLVEEAVKKANDFDEIKEIKPVFNGVVKPIIENRKQDLKSFDDMGKNLENTFKGIRSELVENVKIDRSKFKIKL